MEPLVACHSRWYPGMSFLSRFLSGLGDVVVVVPNYRLGVLGFLKINDSGITSENMGLYDQQLAFEWVHHNIGYFGGNRSAVVAMGEGSGATSIGLHLFAESVAAPVSDRAPLPTTLLLIGGSPFVP